MKLASGSARAGIVREGRVLLALADRTIGERCPLAVPDLVGLDEASGAVALRWLEGAETLHAFHERTGRYGAGLAASIGRALGWLHGKDSMAAVHAAQAAEAAEAAPEDVPGDGDFAELFTYVRPAAYARLSRAGIALIGAVQRHREAAAALSAIARESRHPADRRLLHGDVKPANILRLPGDRPRLVFVDWERSMPGEPARDLGSLLAEYVLRRLAPEPGARALRGDTLSTFARALLAAYRAERGPQDPPGDDFESRIVCWVALGVLVHLYGITHYEGTFDSRSQQLAAYAADMLGAPARWIPEILG